MPDTQVKDSSRGRNIRSNRCKLEMFFFLICGIFLRIVDAAPLETNEDSTRREASLISGLPSKKGHDEEVGNPSELAWQAWLLVDGHSDPPSSGVLDSASLLRRITPKSIFIAPALTACAEGYQADNMNRCVKDVSVDRQAHFGFLVERLNAMYANAGKPQASSLPSSSSLSSGPLQLNIPLFLSGPPKTSQEISKTDSQEKSENSALNNEESSTILHEEYSKPHNEQDDRDAIVTVYELDDERKENEGTFFLGNKSTEIFDKDSQITATKLDQGTVVVPVGEFVSDPTANLSDVVDYKIPAAIEKILNRTRIDNLSDSRDELENDKNHDGKDTEVSPTLVLLLSPTKLPSAPVSDSNDHIVAHNSSLGQVVIKMENVTGNMTGEEIIRVSVPETISSSSIPIIDKDSKIPVNTFDEEKELPTGVINDRDDSREESTLMYDEDVNYEESTETEDEILKHSEAGMTITMPTNERTSVEPPMKFHDAMNESDKDPTGSSEISSEVSINVDFVRETTLVDFNVSKLPNSTMPTTTTSSFESTKILEETTTNVSTNSKQSEVPETIVQTSSDNLRNEKRDGRPTRIGQVHEDFRLKDRPAISIEAPELENPGEEDTSIRKDFIREKVPEEIFPVRGIEEGFDDLANGDPSSTERTDSGETMVAVSTNDAAVITREKPKFDMLSDKRAGQPFRFSNEMTTAKILSRPIIYDYEPLDYPPRPNPYGIGDEDSPPIIRTIDEQRRPPENIFDLSRDREKHFPSQSDYVRFPNYDGKPPESYVRFPVEEANSIHSSNDYKERNRRPYGGNDEIYNRGENSRINLPDVRQRESYWWLPTGWRDDRQQQQQSRSRSNNASEQRSRDRSPMLLRFWTRMPLVRDPSLMYPTNPSPRAERRQGNPRMESKSTSSREGTSRRVNYYKEMSNRDINRAFARNNPGIGG